MGLLKEGGVAKKSKSEKGKGLDDKTLIALPFTSSSTLQFAFGTWQC